MSAPDPHRALWLLDDGSILGGGQLFALRLARWAGRPARIVCPAGSPLWHRAQDQGVPVVDAAFPPPTPASGPVLAAAAWRLRAALADARRATDVIVSGGIRCSLVAGAALAGRRDAPPLVHLMHERDSAARASVRMALRRSRRVLAIGAVAGRAYREALPGARITQANNFLAPDVLDTLVARRAVASDAGPRRLGVLARIIPEKGVAELVDELAGDHARWASLDVAGALQDAAEVARVRRRIAANGLDGRVRVLGAVDDVAAFLAGVDVLVVPSVGNEAQPTAILEALAAGVPVVARAPLVSDDFAGLPVVPYADAPGLSAALAALPEQPSSAAELARRFGPEQAVDAIDRAAA